MTSRFDVIRDLWEIEGDVGYDPDVLDEWTSRFGAVPAALAEYYVTLAAHRELNHSQDQLVAPTGTPGVRFRMDGDDDGDVLTFYVENQAVLQWGIPVAAVAEDDPFVWVLEDEQWSATSDTVSDFLIAQAHLQRMWAWEDSSEDFFDVDDESMARLRGFLPPRGVEAALYGGVEFFGGPGVVLTYFADSSSVAFACTDPHLVGTLLAFFARHG